MTKLELIKSFREQLINNYSLRAAISVELMIHEVTIKRWCINNNPKLCTNHFLTCFRKHSGISKNVQLTNEVVITQPHDLVA